MAIKTWAFEAESIEYGQAQIWVENGILYMQRGYFFKDAEGNNLNFGQMAVDNESILLSMPWAEVPENIRTALEELDAYSINMINQKEGIT